MKELYLNAEMDVVKFAANDVITTSQTTGGDPVVTTGAPTTTEWVPKSNMGAPDYGAWD